MKSLPKISIVIPSYNKRKYIEKTLKSIFAQEYGEIEVIIQDGGSTDGSLEVIKKYAAKYPEIIIWESKKDRGQADAINTGFKKAKGDILTFINADDVYKSNALKLVAGAYIENPKALWVAGRGATIDGSGKDAAVLTDLYKEVLRRINSYNVLLSVNYLMQPSVFISRNAYKKYGPFDASVTGAVLEYGLWLRLGRASMPILVNKCLSAFRLVKGNLSLSNFKILLKEDYDLCLRQTQNPFRIIIHKVNNIGRRIIAGGFQKN